MLNYQSEKPYNKFLMLENEAHDELSPNALYLYICYRNLQAKEDNSNANLKIKSGMKKTRFDAAKAELFDKGYLDSKQLHGNKYALYIGKQSVKRYKLTQKKSENRHVQHELRKIKKSVLEG